jgi:hypothetical protein
VSVRRPLEAGRRERWLVAPCNAAVPLDLRTLDTVPALNDVE